MGAVATRPLPGTAKRGELWIEPAARPLFENLGLDSVDALFEYEGGECGRRLPTRENWKLTLDDGATRVVAHLKKHCGPGAVSTRWRESPARFEARMCREVAACGVPTMRVLAVGEGVGPDGVGRSVFMTEDLTGFVPLDLWFLKNAGGPRFANLWDGLAEAAGRFHAAGFNHRDFYSCHWFVRENSRPGGGDRDGETGDRVELRLIDLQRVQRRPAFGRRRWVVKDLGQLYYSCPRSRVGPDRWRRFLTRHGSAEGLFDASLRRAAAMERKHGPYRDWDHGRGEVWAD